MNGSAKGNLSNLWSMQNSFIKNRFNNRVKRLTDLHGKLFSDNNIFLL
jgi:hypothetical protein